jgi:hypothetical protein
MKNTELNLKEKLAVLDGEFKDFLQGLKYSKTFPGAELQTFSPVDALCDFEQHGLQKLREVSSEEIMQNEDGLKKLLANMLQHCRPGVLSNEDVDQLSGINGREINVGL